MAKYKICQIKVHHLYSSHIDEKGKCVVFKRKWFLFIPYWKLVGERYGEVSYMPYYFDSVEQAEWQVRDWKKKLPKLETIKEI